MEQAMKEDEISEPGCSSWFICAYLDTKVEETKRDAKQQRLHKLIANKEAKAGERLQACITASITYYHQLHFATFKHV